MSLNTRKGAFVIFSLAVSMGGCATEETNRTATTSSHQSELPVVAAVPSGETRLRLGQLMSIELDSNASTGYGWEIVEDGDPVVEPAPVPASAAPSAPPMPGAGGTSRWRYRAVQSGSTTVRLVYRRAWEKDVEPVYSASYRVVVE